MPRSLADKVVNTSLRVKPDETVIINTWQHTIPLSNQIAYECRNAGALPTILLDTDDYWWKALTKIPADNLRKPSRQLLKMLDETNVAITLMGPEDPTTYRRVEGPQMAAFMEAFQPQYDKVREKKIRSAELMVGQVTKPRAKTYGYNYARWKRNVENSSNVDYKKMAQIGKKVASRLETGKQVEVTTNTGTNLKLEIGTHPVHIEDGIIDEADQEKGFIFTSIPTGYVTTAPLPSSAEGTVHFDLPAAFMGRLLKGLKWEFQAGRVVKSSADKYPEAFSKLYDNATGDKDVIATVSLGINPESKPMGYTTDWLGLGIVSIGIGENRYIGGNNNSDFQYQGSLAKATVKVDGKPLVEKGRLAL